MLHIFQLIQIMITSLLEYLLAILGMRSEVVHIVICKSCHWKPDTDATDFTALGLWPVHPDSLVFFLL